MTKRPDPHTDAFLPTLGLFANAPLAIGAAAIDIFLNKNKPRIDFHSAGSAAQSVAAYLADDRAAVAALAFGAAAAFCLVRVVNTGRSLSILERQARQRHAAEVLRR